MNPAPSEPVTLSEPNLSQLDFNNTEIAFKYKGDGELKKSHMLFRAVGYNFLVKIGPPLVNLALDLHFPIKGILKSYFFDQFCGGVTLEDTLAKMEHLYKFGVCSTLDYSVEAQHNEAGYQACANEILRAVEYGATRKEIPFVAMKMTGFGSTELLEKAQNSELSGHEKHQFALMYDRLDTICKRAHELGMSVLIDAEESWIQEPIDRMAEEMMIRYNKDFACVYGTAQLYRKDRYDYIQNLHQKIKSKGAIPAMKLVRGAYLEKETLRAKRKRYPNPLNPNKLATDAMFNKALYYILLHLDEYALYSGSHNEESNMIAVRFVNEKNIARDHRHLHFSQLYGMSDHITFNLGHYGLNVHKYLPYGPLTAVLPYLFRRAQENTSIAGQSGRELSLIERELSRRRKVRV